MIDQRRFAPTGGRFTPEYAFFYLDIHPFKNILLFPKNMLLFAKRGLKCLKKDIKFFLMIG